MFDPQLFQGSATGPRAILRLLQVLECLAEHPEGRTLSQICAALEVPKTTRATRSTPPASTGWADRR